MGPLEGFKVVELAGIGPAPFCGMVLADMGADVLRVDRPAPADLGLKVNPRFDVLNRGKRSIAVDLKQPEGVAAVLRLIAQADALIEGFRPGVAERLGLGPEDCLAVNQGLIYGRVTGWGQDGPLAQKAGHDINYLALTGVLNAIGRAGQAPVPPLNLVGDFGGGGMLLTAGVLAALLQASRTGQGQVVDAAMTEGALLLMAGIIGMRSEGNWNDARGTNSIDTGAPFYDVYETSEGGFIAIGAIEAKFFAALIEGLGLNPANLPDQWDRARWPELRQAIAGAVQSRTRDDWVTVFASLDACVTPVLTLDEAAAHPQNRSRNAFAVADGIQQPAPVPRFSETPGAIAGPAPTPGEQTRTALSEWGFSTEEIDALASAGRIKEDMT